MRRRFLLLLSLIPAPLLSQGVVIGTVRDDSTGHALPGVEVLIEGSDRRATTDASGRYLLPAVQSGTQVALVRLIGFRPVRLFLRVTTGDTTWANVLLHASAQQLEPVTTIADPERREWHLRTFEENRGLGFGEFLDPTYLRRWAAVNLSDVMARVPGVVIVCDPGPGYYKPCYAATTRGVRLSPCIMRVFVDGQLSRFNDIRTGWKVSDLLAVEIYRSAAEIPAAYNSASSACGVLALWTRKP